MSEANLIFERELPSEEDLIKQIRLTNEIVWKKNQNIVKSDIDDWLSNFNGEVFSKAYEDQLALWLLANFVFYNEDEVKHLCKTLYNDFIHKFIIEDNESDDIEVKYNRILNRVRFYSLGKPGESSSFILYYFRQINELPIEKFITRFDTMKEDVDTIVLVDDVALSTGKQSQAARYVKKLKLEDSRLKDKRIVLLTLVATQDAIDFLKNEQIEVVNCITLDSRHKCFHNSSIIFSHFKEHLENAKQFAEHYGKKIKTDDPLGFNDGQYNFGFFYNTPDNTLPIIWSEQNNWQPIRKRYDKNYYNKAAKFGKYL